MSGTDFNHVYNLLKTLDLDRKKKIKGLSSGRADILPSALSAISAFKKYMNLDNMVISSSGLRTGILFNYTVPTTIDKPISDVLTYSLTAINDFYGCDPVHTERMVNLSVQLFKQLRVLHKFPRQYLKILKVAAYLHDTGRKVGYYNYEKHSGYIVLNSNIYGMSHRDIVMASFVAANTSIEEINAFDWARYHDLLTDEDADAVRKMGIMLRLADSFDRRLSGAVSGIA